MARDEELRMVVEELIQVMHQQTKGLEKLVDDLGQTVGRLKEGADLSVIGSQLTALHVRAKQLVGEAHKGK